MNIALWVAGRLVERGWLGLARHHCLCFTEREFAIPSPESYGPLAFSGFCWRLQGAMETGNPVSLRQMWFVVVASCGCHWGTWWELQWAKQSCSFNNLFSILKSGLISNRPIPVRLSDKTVLSLHILSYCWYPPHSQSGDMFNVFLPLSFDWGLRPHTDWHAKVKRDPLGCQTSEILTQRCWRGIHN